MYNSKSKLMLMVGTLAFMYSFQAIAQSGDNGAGNGGSGMICFNNPATKKKVQKTLIENLKQPISDDPFTKDVLDDISSVEVLDLYRAEMPNLAGNDYHPIQALPGEKENEIVADRQKELLKKDSIFAAMMEKTATNTLPYSVFHLADGGVVQINDTDSDIIPNSNCLLAQIAVQKYISNSREKSVDIDERLWKKLNSVNKAALLEHERLYSIAIDRKQRNSRAVQDVVGMLFDSTFDQMSGYDIATKLFSLGFKDYGPGGILLERYGFLEHLLGLQIVDKNAGTLILTTDDQNVVLHDKETNAPVIAIESQDVISGYDVGYVDVSFGKNASRALTIQGTQFLIFEFLIVDPNRRDEIKDGGLLMTLAHDVMFKQFPLKAGTVTFRTLQSKYPAYFVAGSNFVYQGIPVTKNSTVYLTEDGKINCYTGAEFQYKGIQVATGSNVAMKDGNQIVFTGYPGVTIGKIHCPVLTFDDQPGGKITCNDSAVKETSLNITTASGTINHLIFDRSLQITAIESASSSDYINNVAQKQSNGAVILVTVNLTSAKVSNNTVVLNGDVQGSATVSTHDIGAECGVPGLKQLTTMKFAENGELLSCQNGALLYGIPLKDMTIKNGQLASAVFVNPGSAQTKLRKIGRNCRNDVTSDEYIVFPNDNERPYCHL